MSWPSKYPRTPHWYKSETVNPDDRIHQDPEFFLNKEVVITEKIDGQLTCLYNGKAYARSMDSENTTPWLAMARKNHAWKFNDKDLAFYGEDIYGIHSIKYNPVRETETLRIFFTRSNYDRDLWESWEYTEGRARNLKMLTVPVLYRGEFKRVEDITDFFKNELSNNSSIGGDDREGFVIRLSRGFLFEDFGKCVAKYVRPNHVQTDRHWTRKWKSCGIIWK